MEKESLLSYFTKDSAWMQPFVIGSILFYINFALNSYDTKDMSIKLIIMLVFMIIGCFTQGYFTLNTHSLVNCQNGEVKLAQFNDPVNLFITGFKYNFAVFLYCAGLGFAAALIVPPLMAGISALSIIMLVIGIFAVIYLLWMFVYMSFAYSRFLTFRSMFEFSNFGKYRVGKYILYISVFFIIAISVSIFFALMMKDKRTFTYFIALLLSPAAMWYSFVLSKIQAESIQETIIKEGGKPSAAV